MKLRKMFVCVAAGIVINPVLAADNNNSGYHLIKKNPVPELGGWDCLTMDSRNHLVYITRGSHVMAVNVETGKVDADIKDLNGVHGVAIDPKNNHGFISNGRANSVVIFDTKTYKKLNEVSVGNNPDVVLFDAATERVFAFNHSGNSVTAIDAKSDKVVDTITLPGSPEFAVSDGHGHIYNNIEDKSEIVDIDSKNLKVLHEWSVAPGEEPSGIAMDVKHRRLFSVCHNQKMIVLDADSGKVVASPEIGNGPDGCVFDPDNGNAFSPNGADGTITVVHEVDPDHYKVDSTFTTQKGARTITYDPKTHHVFVFTADMATADPNSSQQWRRSYVPGTFMLLEYGL